MKNRIIELVEKLDKMSLASYIKNRIDEALYYKKRANKIKQDYLPIFKKGEKK